MIHDHAVVSHYERHDQPVHVNVCRFTVLLIAYPATCLDHLLWPSSGTCYCKDMLHVTQNVKMI